MIVPKEIARIDLMYRDVGTLVLRPWFANCFNKDCSFRSSEAKIILSNIFVIHVDVWHMRNGRNVMVYVKPGE